MKLWIDRKTNDFVQVPMDKSAVLYAGGLIGMVLAMSGLLVAVIYLGLG